MTHEQKIRLCCAAWIAEPVLACGILANRLGRRLTEADYSALDAVRESLPPMTGRQILEFESRMPPDLPLKMPPGFLTKVEQAIAKYDAEHPGR
jgi:hypothetical protein